ncbi:DUF4129 domain-containing protein [Nesterenkonia pannonica]|uniref:DUF4129 domain-containing protein n=1 Tax=Nesterenkonia pannonica TaxID=1548602 RepID=UPI002164B8C7|nr:DUF4129 domain-containing protein [Nesterenkonia pannonica]
MTPAASYTPDEARELLRSELSEAQYQRELSGPLREAFDDFLRWLDARFADATGLDVPFGPLLLLVLAAAAVITVVLLIRPRLERAPSAEPQVDIDPTASAAQLRSRAEEHAHRGEHAEAFRDTYRAMARSAEERAIVTAQAGRTATEIARALDARFGSRAGRLQQAAEDFSRSLYGAER